MKSVEILGSVSQFDHYIAPAREQGVPKLLFGQVTQNPRSMV